MHRRFSVLVFAATLAVALPFAGCGDNDNEEQGFDNCGNGVIDDGEECDDGNQSDNDDCLSTCVDATCGDGFLNEDEEECDGSQLGGETCTSLGLPAGTLACQSNCTFDESGCGTGATPTPAETPTAGTPGDATPTATSTPVDGELCASGQMITVVVSLSPDYGGAVVNVAYPTSVNIPGNAGAMSVQDRVTFAPSGGFSSVNDQDTNSDASDDTLTLSFAGTTLNPAGTFATIEFDCVEGQPAPAPGAFTCAVDSGADDLGNPLDLACGLTVTGP